MSSRCRASSLVLLVILLACAGGACREPVEAPAKGTSLAEHMESHFIQAKAAQDAVILGDLGNFHAAARDLAEAAEQENLPEVWHEHAGPIRAAAGRATVAPDIEEAAAAVAALAQACGQCHEATQVGLSFPGLSAPAEEDGVAAHMARHQWAADRMWEGLIGPSGRAWSRGAEALVHASLLPQEITDRDELYGQLTALAHKTHELGSKGVGTQGARSRAELYGEFLTTCAKCHQLTRTTRVASR